MSNILASLSESERKKLYAQLAHEFSRNDDAMSVVESDYWDSIHTACHMRPSKSFADFVKQAGVGGRSGFAAKGEDIYSLIERGSGVIMRRPMKLAAMALGHQYLAEDLESRSIPVTPLILVRNHQHVRGAFERRFPGYIASKLLHRIIPTVRGH